MNGPKLSRSRCRRGSLTRFRSRWNLVQFCPDQDSIAMGTLFARTHRCAGRRPNGQAQADRRISDASCCRGNSAPALGGKVGRENLVAARCQSNSDICRYPAARAFSVALREGGAANAPCLSFVARLFPRSVQREGSIFSITLCDWRLKSRLLATALGLFMFG